MSGGHKSVVEFVLWDGPKGFVKVWRKVVLEPREFYRHMLSTGGLQNPLVFLAISGAFYFILKVVVSGLPNAVNAFFLVCLAFIFGRVFCCSPASTFAKERGITKGPCAYVPMQGCP